MDNYYGPLTPELIELQRKNAKRSLKNAISEADESNQKYEKWKAETPWLKRWYQKINDPFNLDTFIESLFKDHYFCLDLIPFFDGQRLLEADAEKNLRRKLYRLSINLGDAELYRLTANRLPWDMSREDFEKQMRMNFAYQRGGPNAAYKVSKSEEKSDFSLYISEAKKELGM